MLSENLGYWEKSSFLYNGISTFFGIFIRAFEIIVFLKGVGLEVRKNWKNENWMRKEREFVREGGSEKGGEKESSDWIFKLKISTLEVFCSGMNSELKIS